MIRRMVVACAITASALRAQGVRPAPLVLDPRAPVAARRLAPHTVFDSSYRKPRRIWVYTPTDYDAKAAAYPLIVAFDGAEYRDTMPLPWILDTLRAARKAPAFVAVLIDNSEGAERIADLDNAQRMSRFLSSQLTLGAAALARDDRSETHDRHWLERWRARLGVRGARASRDLRECTGAEWSVLARGGGVERCAV